MILLLAFFAPLTELFPNLHMSWFEPSNNKLMTYLNTGYLRVAVVLVVWLPILFTLADVTSTILVVIIGLMVFGAFGRRGIEFKQVLTAELEDREHRGPPFPLPETLYFLSFIAIGIVLFIEVPDNPWLVPIGVLGILTGAVMMGRFRRGPGDNALTFDVIGRIIFSVGFTINLYNLARAAEIL